MQTQRLKPSRLSGCPVDGTENPQQPTLSWLVATPHYTPASLQSEGDWSSAILLEGALPGGEACCPSHPSHQFRTAPSQQPYTKRHTLLHPKSMYHDDDHEPRKTIVGAYVVSQIMILALCKFHNFGSSNLGHPPCSYASMQSKGKDFVGGRAFEVVSQFPNDRASRHQ